MALRDRAYWIADVAWVLWLAIALAAYLQLIVLPLPFAVLAGITMLWALISVIRKAWRRLLPPTTLLVIFLLGAFAQEGRWIALTVVAVVWGLILIAAIKSPKPREVSQTATP